MAGQTEIVVPVRGLVLHRLNVVSDDGLDLATPLVLTNPEATSITQAPVMVPVRSRGTVRVLVSFQLVTGEVTVVLVGYDSDGVGGYNLVGIVDSQIRVAVVGAQYLVASGKFAGQAPASFSCAGVDFVQVRMHTIVSSGTGIDAHLNFA